MSTATEKPAAAGAPPLDWDAPEIAALLERALAEDLGAGDLTTDAVLPEAAPATGHLIAGQALVVAGLPLAARVFRLLDAGVKFSPRFEEGAEARRGAALAEIAGDVRALLGGERTALNFLQRLCGIASLTRRYAMRLTLGRSKARLLDTRKTTPGLRALEKYAVRLGGGANHRFGLFDAVLVKDNHARAVGGLGEAVRRAKKKYGSARRLQAETASLAEVREALEAGADALLLDNMDPQQILAALELIAGRATVELSGGITLDTLDKLAALGADFISVGALTHSAPAADISFELESAPRPRLRTRESWE